MPQNNTPDLWIHNFPQPDENSHKYKRGSSVIFGAPSLTGSSRLSASACSRLCGAVTVCAPQGTGDIYRTSLPPQIMVRDFQGDIPEYYFSDYRVKSLIAGPGGGYGDEFLRNIAYRAWEQKHLNGLVLDAEGFKAWRGDLIEGFSAFVNIPTIVTPHEGEFEYVFGAASERHQDIMQGEPIERAQKAAEFLNAIVVLKGHETIIAMAGRDPVVNKNASPYLATAGSGDVLSGMIGGLLAAGMLPFDAACAAVWIHGETSKICGPGMVASDISEKIPKVLKEMLGIEKKVG